MNVSRVSLKSLQRAVKRLEASVGKGQRHCAVCRYRLRHAWLDPKKPQPQSEDVLKSKCEFCQSEYTITLAQTQEEEREVLRLRYSFTMEDHYTNPIAHAFQLWSYHQPKIKELRKRNERITQKGNNDANARIFAKLSSEMAQMYAQKHKRRKAKYGDSPFPEHMQLIESVRNREMKKRSPKDYVAGLFDLEQEETSHRIRAELEKIIWGQTRPETASAIEKLERDINELIKTAKEEKERRAEESRRKNLDFLNNNRASCGMAPLPDDYGKNTVG